MLLSAIFSLALAAAPAVTPEVRAYLDQRITAERFVAAGSGLPLRTEYRRGGELLLGGEVYEIIGRDDLAKVWWDRNNFNWALGGAGLGSLATGIGVLVWSGSTFQWQNADRACEGAATIDACVAEVEAENTAAQRGRSAGTAIAGVLALGGTVSVVVAKFRRAHPIPNDEILWMVGEYNQRLANELGVTVSLTPALRPDGGALAVTLRY
ncbi:MAG: hypothetical protein V4850_31095 [Myxococcota bacterium]